ncbi:MAG: cell division protein [Novosphingobium sp.]
MSQAPAFLRGVTTRLSGLAGKSGRQLLPQARLAGPMLWVIAIMIALTVVAAAGGLALANVAGEARGELSGAVTVQIVEAGAEAREAQARAALARLQRLPGVADVARVPDEEIGALLAPWLGEANLGGSGDASIAVPALIDLRLNGAADGKAIAALRKALAEVAPAARVDAQADWLKPVFSAIHSLQWLAASLILLLAAATIAAVWLAARSALGTNRETIEIVHHLGGTDAQIARIFQRSVAFDAALGSIAGLALGLIAVLLMGSRFAALGSGMVTGGGLRWQDWLLIAAIPLVGTVLAALTARFTVMAALRRML